MEDACESRRSKLVPYGLLSSSFHMARDCLRGCGQTAALLSWRLVGEAVAEMELQVVPRDEG